MIELMITVALIAILATIAMPAFTSTSRKAKADAEVQPMFSDLRTKMEQYAQENGLFPPSIGESTTHPATPTSAKQALSPMPAEWVALKVRISGSDQVYCGYTWVTGLADDATNIGAEATAFGFTAPSTAWYYLLAHCDLDGSSSVDSFYFSSSVDPTILKRNEGR